MNTQTQKFPLYTYFLLRNSENHLKPPGEESIAVASESTGVGNCASGPNCSG